MPKHVAPLNTAHFHCEPLPPDNGEAPVSFSLTLSGGFDVAFSTGLHSPGSLSNYANAYYSRSLRFFCHFSNAIIPQVVKFKRGFFAALRMTTRRPVILSAAKNLTLSWHQQKSKR